MKRKYTYKEISHLKQAFRSPEGDQGLIETLIFNQFCRNPSLDYGEKELVETYQNHSCCHVSKLVEIAFREKIWCFKYPFSFNIGDTEVHLVIGYPNMSVCTWFSCLAEDFAKLSKEQREAFDDCCGLIIEKLKSPLSRPLSFH